MSSRRRLDSQPALNLPGWTLVCFLMACGLASANHAESEVLKNYDRISVDDNWNRRFDLNYNGIPDDCENGVGRRFSRTSPWNRPRWGVIPAAGGGVPASVCLFPRVLADTTMWFCVDAVNALGDTTPPSLSVFGSDRQVLDVRTVLGRTDRMIRIMATPVRPWPIGSAYVLIVTRQDSLWAAVRVTAAKPRPK